eukprot:SAG11_NODE_19711_length_460_cov_1.645429_1_plen_53_part_10
MRGAGQQLLGSKHKTQNTKPKTQTQWCPQAAVGGGRGKGETGRPKPAASDRRA